MNIILIILLKRCQNMSEVTLKCESTDENYSPALSLFPSPPPPSCLLSPHALPPRLPLPPFLVRELSISSTTPRWRVLSGIEAFIRFLFQSVWCLFNAVEMEKCSSYNDNYYCFGIMVKDKTKKKKQKKETNKRNVLLNVVQIALEMLCFLKRAQTWATVPSSPPSGRWE